MEFWAKNFALNEVKIDFTKLWDQMIMNIEQPQQCTDKVTRGRVASDTGSEAEIGPDGYYNFNQWINISGTSNSTADVSQ